MKQSRQSRLRKYRMAQLAQRRATKALGALILVTGYGLTADIAPAGASVADCAVLVSTSPDSDPDADGMSNVQECSLPAPTDPTNADTDSDGLSDGTEFWGGATNPVVFDSDGDGLGDGAEYYVHVTNPTLRHGR